MTYIVSAIDSQFTDWESFDCGDARLNRKLIREISLADAGFQKIYGAFTDESKSVLAGVATLRCGQLQATPEDVARLARRTGVIIPTLHIEVLAVQVQFQRIGIGETLVTALHQIAEQVYRQAGLYCLSLEATAESVPFYQKLGFEASETIYADESRAMWLVL